MTRLLQGPGRAARTLALLVALMVLPVATARAQYFGYGGFSYGYPGYGYGYPGIGYGYGFPGVGYGYGYPGVGYGYGLPGVSFGYGYGYPGVGYGYAGYAYAYPGFRPYITAGTGPGAFNPLFGLGLSPLGVQSALTEASMRAGAARPVTGAAVGGRVNPGTSRMSPNPNPNPNPNTRPNNQTIRPK
jgi:hypothetical protein